jgi:hypothetical protein
MKPAVIMHVVASMCGVTAEQMQSRLRKRNVVFAKWITVKLLLIQAVPEAEILALFPNHSRQTVLDYTQREFDSLLTFKPFKILFKECAAMVQINIDEDLKAL